MYYDFENFAYGSSKTERREARRKVRTALGTSSDRAPNIRQALSAANALGTIIALASGGRYRLAIEVVIEPGNGPTSLSPAQAIVHVNQLQKEREERMGQ